jgi:hypothetical protein
MVHIRSRKTTEDSAQDYHHVHWQGGNRRLVKDQSEVVGSIVAAAVALYL